MVLDWFEPFKTSIMVKLQDDEKHNINLLSCDLPCRAEQSRVFLLVRHTSGGGTGDAYYEW